MDINEKQFYEISSSDGYYLTLANLANEDDRIFVTSHCWLDGADSIENWVEWSNDQVEDWQNEHAVNLQYLDSSISL